MSFELKPTFGMTYVNNALADKISTETLNINQNVAGFVANTVAVPNTQTNIALPLTTLGYVYLKNVSIGTNFIQYGPISGTTWNVFGRLNSNDSALLRLEPGITLRAVANTNTASLFIKGYND